MTTPAAEALSPQTMVIAGLQTDIYGLELLPQSCAQVTCLWLHHQRTRTKESMGSFASLVLSAYYSSEPSPPSSARGLLCLAFDHRNHGTRAIASDTVTIDTWRGGNPNHAIDMWGMVNGMVSDQSLLIDLAEGYLFPDGDRQVDQHLILGVSLGGHSAWQAMFADKRVRGGVSVIGCPDYMSLLTDRAALSKLPTFIEDKGATFLGSKNFPRSLVEACKKGDPKGILFGTEKIEGDNRTGSPTRASQQASVRQRLLYERLEGKRLLVCSGGLDKLVPMRCVEPFMTWLKGAVEQPPPPTEEQRIVVVEKIYKYIAHEFSEAMEKDAADFLVDAVRRADEDKCNPLKKDQEGLIPAKV